MEELPGLQVATFIVWLVSAVTFIFALKFLASPQTARRGNLLGAAGMALIVAWTFFTVDGMLDNWWIIVVAGLIGSVAGVLGARRVPMTAMPQMVAIFHGAGGGAAAVVALAEFLRDAGDRTGGDLLPLPFMIATLAGAVIGSVSLTGSIIAFGKLQGIVAARPVKYPGSQIVTAVLALAILGLGVYVAGWDNNVALFLLYCVLALALGIQLVMPIGGADMPVVVSLLNSYTGIAVAATGFVLSNYALLIAGTLVGASGAILTQLMCKAMNRSLFNVLFAGFGSGGEALAAAEGEESLKEISAEDAAVLMAYGKRVIIVPGYGMAVAQAQGPVRELMDLLVSKGVDVQFAIHPVAGRMPGHMNVLLAEANVPYDKLREMDDINPEMERVDVAVVIGANDVVNPGARTDTSSPIYGMPIINADYAKSIIVLKRSMAAGFAGIENELFYNPKTSMLFGDAKQSLTKVISEIKQ